MAKVGRAITIGGVRYAVLQLSSDPRGAGPAFLLRSNRGDVIGLFRQGAQPMRLRAYKLRSEASAAALHGFEFFDDDGELVCRATSDR